MKLLSKIILLFSMVFLIGGAAAVYFVYNSSIHNIKRQITDNLEDAAFHTMDKIETVIFERYMDMKTLAADQVISSRSSTPEQITRSLKEFQDKSKIYLSLSFFHLNRIRIADTAGQLIGVQHRLEDFWVPISEGREFTVDIHHSESLGRPVFHFVSVVKDKNGVPFGAVVSRMPLDDIYTIVEKAGASNRDREPMKISLIDSNGNVLYTNDKDQGKIGKVSRDWEYIKHIVAGQKIGSLEHIHFRDEEIAVFAREEGHRDFKGNNWTLLISLPANIAFAPAVQMTNKMTAILTVTGVLFFLCIVYISKKITRPVIRLNNAATEIGKGNLDVRVEVTSGDEIGQLSTSFNGMAEQLKQLELKRKEAQESLIESEASYRNLFESSTDGIFIIDFDGSFIDANMTAYERLGYTREEFLAMNISKLDHPDFAARARDRFRQIREQGSAVFESAHLRKDGSVMPVEVNSRVIEHRGRQVFFSVIRDITDRKKAEERIQTAEKRMLMAMTAAKQGFFEIDIRTDNIVVSPSYARMMGYEPHEFANKWSDLIHPDDRGLARRILDEYINGRRDDCRSEFRQQTKSGRWRWISSVGNIVEWDSRGIPTRLFGIYTDITESKQAGDALRKSELFIRTILDTVDEGFIVVDRDFRIITANKAYCSLADEICDVIGRHCYEISHRTLKPCYEEGEDCAVRHVFTTGEPHTAIHRHRDSKGGILYVETKAFPITDSSGAVISAIETINNITERYLLEEERLKTQKLEAIGTLAGGIAHDFNNLLQGVFGYMSLARLRMADPGKCTAALEEAEKALHMSVNLTNQLLTFSKGGKPVKAIIDLRPVIQSAVKFALSGSRSHYRVSVEDGLWLVDADEGQIAQVIQNIVLNADQAMPEGGHVEVAAKNIQTQVTGVPSEPGQGRYVEIAVTDTGLGIPEEDLIRIFDPYFTTKQRGSGLGLATSYSIVKNHGGFIDVRSECGRGSTFRIYLPAVISVETKEESAPGPEPAVKRGRILLMDDEELVLNVGGELIRALGHDVIFAADGAEAIEKYRSSLEEGRPVDVVILDLTIRGGMGGTETLKRLFEISPDVKAVVSSGYSDDSAIAAYEARGFQAVLKKPYNMNQLREVLGKLLQV